MKRGDVQRGLRRGVFVIPTFLTVMNLFFGFRCIVNSMRAMQALTDGRPDRAMEFFQIACFSLFVAAIFDTFDGLIARSLDATSEFGKEYDSLADVVTFGAAPAVLVYAWGLHTLDRLGGGIAFLFLVAVSLRLARFNVMTGKSDYRYFAGLPSPAGALTIAAIVNYAPAPIHDPKFAMVMLLLTTFVAFAMVSPIRYRSQKGLNLQKERSLMTFLVLALALGIFSKWPRELLFVVAISYLVSGPLLRLWSIAFPSRVPSDETLEPLEAP
ncbi:MAG TPA: CDP-diacylglycerol--serine O-phosphatidyltransferase [Thermoanaerobaculia bacterium]|nr:CDP-diacylglycerol--serine O-phosphatidyltransferase [Thermoanaerobaculia bacterium]